ncbi:hypothetical protein HMI56_005516 [Coelomomyces lativittatus]|nr:hypothetical protein HMI56_005516 [Coelomomyces lativittatus]
MDYELNDVLSVKPPSTPSIHPKPTILPTSPRVLASSTTSPSSSTFLTNPNPVLPTTTSTLPSSPLEKKQQLQLEAENQFFLEQWCAPLEEVQQTESSLLVISQIQAELAQHLANHQVTLEHVWEEAEIQTEHMNEGNKHLSQVLETGRGRRLWFLILVLILSFLLLFLDWYHDRFFKSTYLK